MNSNYPGMWELLEKSARTNASDSRSNKFAKWSKPPSSTETEKCERAVRMVRQAIDEDPELSAMDISVYAKGSFANRTNIPSDSDVDIAVVANNYFFNDYPDGKKDSDFGMVASSYTYSDFKTAVSKAVINKFGSTQVTTGNKSIKVHSNSSRVDADVVPHFVHRRYDKNGKQIDGAALKDLSGKLIKNWPEQDYSNGVDKNDRTNKKYKGLVRTIKSIRSEMKEAGYGSADFASSYLIACLVWNVPDEVFESDNFENVVVDALDYLIEQTSNIDNIRGWGEVNELKYLFRDSQPWSLAQVHKFLIDAKSFIGTL